MNIQERIRQSAVSVVESDFASDQETISGLKRRRHPPKPPGRKLRRRPRAAP
jgi:hypothetical protein